MPTDTLSPLNQIRVASLKAGAAVIIDGEGLNAILDADEEFGCSLGSCLNADRCGTRDTYIAWVYDAEWDPREPYGLRVHPDVAIVDVLIGARGEILGRFFR